MIPRADIQLVINADDFGSTSEISAGILRAHREGVVTSTSVIGNVADPGKMRAVLAGAPKLGVGAHLTLVGGRPVTPAEKIPSLLGPTQRFSNSPIDVLATWAKGLLMRDQVEREFDAQVTRLLDAGCKLDHLDTHQNLGFLPPIGLALEAVARRHGIAGIRSAVESPNLSWFTSAGRGAVAAALAGLSWFTRRQLGALRHGPRTWGYVECGRLDEIRILEILGRLGPGAHELICHPGEQDDRHQRRGELAALTSPRIKDAIAARGIELVRWADLF